MNPADLWILEISCWRQGRLDVRVNWLHVGPTALFPHQVRGRHSKCVAYLFELFVPGQVLISLPSLDGLRRHSDPPGELGLIDAQLFARKRDELASRSIFHDAKIQLWIVVSIAILNFSE